MIELLNSLNARVRLFLQANYPMDESHIGITEILELIELARDEIVSEVISEEIKINNKLVYIGGFRKYKGDEKQHFAKFWSDVEGATQELFNSYYKKQITFNTKQKMITPLMVKRFVPVIIHPLLNIFKIVGPLNVIEQFGTENDPFDWLRSKFLTVKYSNNEIDIIIAQKVITKYTQGK